jgi:lipid-A-disaccharide synthase-like uncharacterized protein
VLDHFLAWWASLTAAEEFWYSVGFFGQLLFTCRFMVQWVASERKKESVVPISFWWLSLSGNYLVLAYAIWKRDPIFVMGQVPGSVIYLRNLMLIYRKPEAPAPAAAENEEAAKAIPFRKAG